MKKVVFLFVLISAMLLSSQTVKADWLLGNRYFNIETHTDHFTVKVLVADLVGRDSWMKDGYIRAYVNEPEVYYNHEEPVDYIDIARVYTFDQDGNGLPMHRIKAQSLMEGATVILDNFNYTKLDHTEKEYSIFKQKDYDYPQAELSIYWGPEMAGKKWYIVYYGATWVAMHSMPATMKSRVLTQRTSHLRHRLCPRTIAAMRLSSRNRST